MVRQRAVQVCKGIVAAGRRHCQERGGGEGDDEGARTVSTKCCRQSWIVRAVLPTPPSPNTTNLYSTILPAILAVLYCFVGLRQPVVSLAGWLVFAVIGRGGFGSEEVVAPSFGEGS